MKKTLTIVAQIILSYVLGFIAPYTLGIGNGLELIAIPIAMALGVCLAGTIVYPLTWQKFVASLIGAAIGAAILSIPNVAFGFAGLLLPFIGAMVGFYIAKAKQTDEAATKAERI